MVTNILYPNVYKSTKSEAQAFCEFSTLWSPKYLIINWLQKFYLEMKEITKHRPEDFECCQDSIRDMMRGQPIQVFLEKARECTKKYAKYKLDQDVWPDDSQ